MQKLFRNMIEKSYPISKPPIKMILEKEDWGVEMLKKVSLDTIVNRLNMKDVKIGLPRWASSKLSL